MHQHNQLELLDFNSAYLARHLEVVGESGTGRTLGVAKELGPLANLLDFVIYDVARQTKLRDALIHHAAGDGMLFENRRTMAVERELAGRCKAGRSAPVNRRIVELIKAEEQKPMAVRRQWTPRSLRTELESARGS